MTGWESALKVGRVHTQQVGIIDHLLGSVSVGIATDYLARATSTRARGGHGKHVQLNPQLPKANYKSQWGAGLCTVLRDSGAHGLLLVGCNFGTL